MEKSELEQKMEYEKYRLERSWNYNNKKTYKLTDLDIREIFKTTHEVNLERDKDGMPIPGTGRVITNEEKKMIFDFIIDHNYPLTRNAYSYVLNAYLNDEIDLKLNGGPKL